MLKNVTQMTVQVGEKIFHMICDHDSPINHVKEALFQFMKIVGEAEQRAKEAQKPADEEKKDDVPEVKSEGTE